MYYKIGSKVIIDDKKIIKGCQQMNGNRSWNNGKKTDWHY